MKDTPTVYHLDRPAARGDLGLGLLMLFGPLSLIVAFSIPGVFLAAFPNAPKRRDPLAMTILGVAAIGIMTTGAFFLWRGQRRLRDRAPKLEYDGRSIIDHRGGQEIEWGRVVRSGWERRTGGSRRARAVVTLTVREASGDREVEIDILGLSEPPERIIDHLKRDCGLF